MNFIVALFHQTLEQSIFFIIFGEDYEARLFNRYYFFHLKNHFPNSSKFPFFLKVQNVTKSSKEKIINVSSMFSKT
ncbi:hypothetical protein BpHYR1_022864 [Brachionus plicatilis]|uniref:Uncharacterized protein n=1 Tax=Brachionus plicatilis TaxID=10195 RepID=A0A3M7RA10_BRAPC|nr:hypothetical protein BpHYR1_022864 [Brachionus plicatilis]